MSVPANPANPESAPHQWVGALTTDLTPREARLAIVRGSIHLSRGGRVDALEVYCRACRRPYEDVADESCRAEELREHLRGGPIGTRKRGSKVAEGKCCIDPAACYHTGRDLVAAG